MTIDWFKEAITLKTVDGVDHVTRAPKYSTISTALINCSEDIVHKIGGRTFYLLPDDTIYEDWGIADYGRVHFVKRVTANPFTGISDGT